MQRIATRIIFEVPCDTHAEPLLIFLQLDHFGDRREQHLVQEAQLSLSDRVSTITMSVVVIYKDVCTA